MTLEQRLSGFVEHACEVCGDSIVRHGRFSDGTELCDACTIDREEREACEDESGE